MNHYEFHQIFSVPIKVFIYFYSFIREGDGLPGQRAGNLTLLYLDFHYCDPPFYGRLDLIS